MAEATLVKVENSPEAWNRRARRTSSDWDAALWSEHGQTARFGAAIQHLNLRPSDNLLDFGCGTGRFVEFVPRTVSYVGVDQASEMLDRARDERRRGSFYSSPPSGWKYDHVVAIGVFNLDDQWDKDRTWSTLDVLWELTRRTLVVSLYRGMSVGSLYYSPSEATSYAMLRTSSFLLDCSYLDNDLLLVMRKEGSA